MNTTSHTVKVLRHPKDAQPNVLRRRWTMVCGANKQLTPSVCTKYVSRSNRVVQLVCGVNRITFIYVAQLCNHLAKQTLLKTLHTPTLSHRTALHKRPLRSQRTALPHTLVTPLAAYLAAASSGGRDTSSLAFDSSAKQKLLTGTCYKLQLTTTSRTFTRHKSISLIGVTHRKLRQSY